MMPTPEEVERAWATVGLRDEGPVLKAWLFSKLMQAAPAGADFSALQAIEAERRVARTILALMGTDLAEPGRHDIDGTAAALAAGRRTGAAERIRSLRRGQA